MANNKGYMGAASFGASNLLGSNNVRHSKKHKSNKKRSWRKRIHKSKSTKSRRVIHHYTSQRRIHTTKNGQPYIILASGKARFIKKKSARIMRKRKGGKY